MVIEYHYGILKYNSDCFADDEFEKVKTRPRIAYFGDSVCHGVGAGHGYRISELLEETYPAYEHMNLTGGLDTGMSMDMAEKYFQLASRFDVDVAIYLMNLNDIGPYYKDQADQRMTIFRIGALFDWLRGRSYLYTFLRYAVKNAVVRLGYTPSGHKRFEFYPDEFVDEFKATAERIDSVGRRLREHGIGFVVLILPYEMQISEEAAETYAQLGIQWGDTLIDRGPQKLLMELLTEGTVIDGYYAFIDPEDAASMVTPRTRAIIALQTWGCPADVDGLRALADRHNLSLSSDSSHAQGAPWMGKPLGQAYDFVCVYRDTV